MTTARRAERPVDGPEWAPEAKIVSGAVPGASGPSTQRLVLLDFPVPAIARSLSPNGRVHWAEKARAADAVRLAVWLAVETQPLTPPPPPVHIVWRWIVPDRRRRDVDNHSTGVIKVAQDHLVKLGVLAADHSEVVTSHTEIVYERGSRRLEIELRPVSSEGPA